MPDCQLCGGLNLSSSTICMMCLNTAPFSAYSSLLSARMPTARAVELVTTLQDASKIEPTGDSTLRDRIDDWVAPMITFLNSRNYWNAATATSVGDQATPSGCTEGTRSLDFQGIRAVNGLYWIDLQAQMGGGGSKRKSYAQVMIQTRLGVDVPAVTIIAALRSSLSATAGTKHKPIGRRAVIHSRADADKLP